MQDERFWRDASGRLTFDASSVGSEDFPAVCRALSGAFALTPDGSLVVGSDQMFWDFRSADQAVGLDWDVWMGFMVVAKTEASEPLVCAIAGWLGSSRWADAGEPT